MNRAVIYARVSSTGDRQSTERQVADLKRYAAASGMEVVAVYEEKASGTKRDREQLAACRAFLLGGGAQHLLVTELSRLGRSLKQVLEVVDELTAAGINVYFQAQGLNTIVDGNPDATVKAIVIAMCRCLGPSPRWNGPLCGPSAVRAPRRPGEGCFQAWSPRRVRDV